MLACETLLQSVVDRREHLDAREALVFGLHQRPGRDLGARAVDHVADRALVGAPFLAVAPVVRRDLEALEGGPAASAEALELLALADLQPELDDDRSAFGELLLELVDLAVGAHPVAHAAVPFDPLDQHAPVPRTIEDGDAAQRRDVLPEPPEIRMRALLVVRRGDGNGDVLARVERS